MPAAPSVASGTIVKKRGSSETARSSSQARISSGAPNGP